MSESDKPRVEVYRGDEGDEWPAEVRERFEYLSRWAHARDFSIICAVGLHHERKRLSVIISGHSSSNPHLTEMLDDIADMFQLMAKRFKQ